jgi:hypothetical protein
MKRVQEDGTGRWCVLTNPGLYDVYGEFEKMYTDYEKVKVKKNHQSTWIVENSELK